MSCTFITVRGNMQTPHLLEVDLQSGSINQTVQLPPTHMQGVPATKGGTSGLHLHDGLLYVATWDTVNVLNAGSKQPIRQVTDRRFSDLHGTFMEDDGCLWITSTNLDGVYVEKQGKVEPFWHAWEHIEEIEGKIPSDWKKPLIASDQDYRLLTKGESSFHRYHINSVWVTDRYVLLSFLGKSYKPAPPSFPQRILRKAHLAPTLPNYQMKGGIFVLDKNGKLVRTIWTEGLHDPNMGADGSLYYSVYFGDALLKLDVNTLETRLIPLEAPSWRTWGYLTRGVFDDGEVIWVGSTQHRSWNRDGWHSNAMAYLRSYTREGKWAGGHMWLPDYAGVYAIAGNSH